MSARTTASVFTLLVSLATSTSVQAQPWRYVGKDGQVYYTSDLNELPQAVREREEARLAEKAARKAAQAAAAAASAPASSPASKPPASGTVTSDFPLPDKPAEPALGAPSRDPELDRARWRRLAQEKREAVEDASHRVETARLELSTAERQAVLYPTGPNFAAREAARDAVRAAEQAHGDAMKSSSELRDAAKTEEVPEAWLEAAP